MNEDNEVIDENMNIEVEIQDDDEDLEEEFIKPIKEQEQKQKKSINETIDGLKNNVMMKINNQDDKKATFWGYAGIVAGVLVFVSLILNYYSINELLMYFSFGKVLLFVLPQILVTVAGAFLCLLNKLFTKNKYIFYGFWINTISFVLIWLVLIWSSIIF